MKTRDLTPYYTATRVHNGRHEYRLHTGQWVSRQRVWQIANNALGLCALCNRKRVNVTHCMFHEHQLSTASRNRARAKAGIPLNQPLHKRYKGPRTPTKT